MFSLGFFKSATTVSRKCSNSDGFNSLNFDFSAISCCSLNSARSLTTLLCCAILRIPPAAIPPNAQGSTRAPSHAACLFISSALSYISTNTSLTLLFSFSAKPRRVINSSYHSWKYSVPNSRAKRPTELAINDLPTGVLLNLTKKPRGMV